MYNFHDRLVFLYLLASSYRPLTRHLLSANSVEAFHDLDGLRRDYLYNTTLLAHKLCLL